MASIKDITYIDRPKAKFGNSTDFGTKPLAPEGVADIWYDATTRELSLPDSAGTTWIDYKVTFSKEDATVAPGVTNDNTENYHVGSLWVDVTANISYIAVDVSTGAAIWTEVGAGGGGGAVGNGDAIPVMWVAGSPLTLSGSEQFIDWDESWITNTNYWAVGDADQLLVFDSTRDHVLEVYLNLITTTGVDDATIQVTRYNSSNVFQDVVGETMAVLSDIAGMSAMTTFRIAASAISTGDYFRVSVLGNGGNVRFTIDSQQFTKLYELTAV